MRACQSYRSGRTCADGFIQKPICRGVAGCFACGQVSSRATPNCCLDELPDHLANDNGSPLFYRGDPS